MSHRLRLALAPILLGMAFAVAAADWAPGSANWADLPEIKRTTLKLYLTPQQALEMKRRDPAGVLFIDVRTRSEAMYVGMPTDADALVPWLEHSDGWLDWDETRNAFQTQLNGDFLDEVKRRLAERSLTNSAPVIVMCRSGDRSARAADRLYLAGFAQVYSVPEGFEGDTAKDGARQGQRSVNGWKNAGLPWSYKLARAKMYFRL